MNSENEEPKGVSFKSIKISFNISSDEGECAKRIYTIAGLDPPEYLSDFLHNIHNNEKSLSKDTFKRLIEDLGCEVFDKDLKEGDEGYDDDNHAPLLKDVSIAIPLENSLDMFIKKLKTDSHALSDDTINKIKEDFTSSPSLFVDCADRDVSPGNN